MKQPVDKYNTERLASVIFVIYIYIDVDEDGNMGYMKLTYSKN